MKPAPFEYFSPETVPEALALAAAHGDEARWLAGGQSLVPAMNFRLLEPAVLLDLNRLSGLAYIDETPEGGLVMGAMTRQRAVERSETVARLSPLLAESMPYIAHPQIRNRGTIGGSLAHADPAAELPVVAVTLDAQLRLQSERGERWVTADQFYEGLFTTALEPGELLTEIHFPAWPDGAGWSFQEVARRHGDYALVGVATILELAADGRCRRVRLVYLNVGERPVVARRAAAILEGQEMGEEEIRAAADLAAAEEIEPVADVHASVPYQRHLVQVLTGRALRQAQRRAANGEG